MSAPDWSRAACLDVDPELFFPDRKSDAAYDYARTKCATCPVVSACLDDAMADEGSVSTGYRHGMRGGLTPVERLARYRASTRAPMTSAELTTLAAMKAASVIATEAKCQAQRDRVATLTTQGQSATEIARTLGIHERTVVRMRTRNRRAAA